MKIFHTADWHIGKLLHKKNLIEDQKEILNKLVEDIDREKPDLLIVAGDLYDTSIPRIEAVELLNSTINEIIKRKVNIIMISGNHDSPDRLSFGSEIFTRNGLYIVTDLRYIDNPIVLEDEIGKVNIYPFPFMTVARGRHEFDREDKDYNIESYNDLAEVGINRVKKNMNLEERNICIYHGLVVNMGNNGNVESDSERPLSIGGTDFIDVDLFDDFDYTALGHLHGPQKVKKDNIRYSGSLMKYSFSEQYQKKGYLKIILNQKDDIKIEFKELYPKRDVRVIEGDMEEVLKLESSDDYIMVRLKVDDNVYEPKSRLNRVFENLLHLEIFREETVENNTNINIKEKLKKKDTIGLFKDFYEFSTNREFTEEKQKIVESLKEELEGSEKNEAY